MAVKRLYVPEALWVGRTISVIGDQHHQLMRVSRVQIGESIILFNGQGGEYQSVITTLDRKQVLINIQQFNNRDVESPLTIHLGQALLRGDAMDWVIQKSVELGASVITPLLCERGVGKIVVSRLERKLEHWQSVIQHACAQCGRNTVPVLHPPVPCAQWLQAEPQIATWMLHPEGEPMAKLRPEKSAVRMAIGPEFGWSSQELDWIRQTNCHKVQLGPRVLRADSAAIVALSCLQYSWGDFS